MKKITIILYSLVQAHCISAQIDLTKGLSVNYPFTGNANDVSGNQFNGTVYNATLTNDRFGSPESAYFYNGVDSYINYGNILNNVFAGVGNKFSISLWIKPFEDMPYKGILCKYADGACNEEQQQICLGIRDNNALLLFSSSLGTGNAVFAKGGIEMTDTSRWYHIVALYDGSISTNGLDRVKFYINNVADQTSAGLPSTGTLGNIQPGQAQLGTGNKITSNGSATCGPGFFFHGAIDDIRVYNRLLNTAEIDALYKQIYVGVSETVSAINCELFPNPVADIINIHMENVYDAVDMTILNSLGQIVYRETIDNYSGPFRHRLDINDYPKGMYFVNLATSQGNVRKKFLLID